MRRWYWIFVRRWETEICSRCGRPVARCTDSWWQAPDALWLEVNGGLGGVLCPPCFTKACRRAGYSVSWRAEVEYALCGDCERVPEACLCQTVLMPPERGKRETAEEFMAGYAKRSGVTVEWLKERMTVRPCDCGEEGCEGWQMVSYEHADRIDDPTKPWAR